MFFRGSVVFALICLFMTGCASGYKARQEMRDKLVNSSGLFCEFVNGEQHPDVDVELNMQMAKRCDATKPFSITNYKTSSEMNGVMYCCQIPGAAAPRARAAAPAPRPAPPVAPPAPKAPPAIAKPEPATPIAPAPAGEDDAVVGE